MLSAFAIFLVTLVLVIWQPKGLGVGWSASLGAGLALLAGVVSLSDVALVWAIVWNATATFIAVIIISLLLDEAGFFQWAALHVARWAKGDGRRLFVFSVLLGAGVSALFANDGAALILTPIVISILLALRFSAASTLAFVMAAGFIADTASLPLVVSNLVNIVSADYFHLGFSEYAAVMVPVNLVAIASTLLVLYVFFRRDIPRHYSLEQLAEPRSAIRDPLAFKVGWAMDRHNPNAVIATSYALGGAFILLLGAFSLESSLLAVGVIAAGFCMSGAQTGLNAFAPGFYPTDCRATGVSWMLGIGRFGAIFGSLIGGAVLSLGLGLPLLFAMLSVPAFFAALAILGNGRARRLALSRAALAH